jgi:hypothetical protein
MYRKLLMLLVAGIFLLGVMQPETAFAIPVVSKEITGSHIFAGLPVLNKPVNDLRVQRTKTATVNGIDRAVNGLEAIGASVERTRLTDGQKASIKSQIDDNITWFESRKADVQASTDVASILQYANEANSRWGDVNSGLKKEIGFMACDNLDDIIATARKASSVASSKIEALKARGKDTSALEKAVASYDGHIESAARDMTSARSEFSAIGKGLDGHYAAGLKQTNAAQGELKSSYKDLKSIYRLLYGNGIKID